MIKIVPYQKYNQEYLTVSQVAQIMGVSKKTVRIWIKEKVVDGLKINKTYYIDKNFIEKIKNENRQDSK